MKYGKVFFFLRAAGAGATSLMKIKRDAEGAAGMKR